MTQKPPVTLLVAIIISYTLTFIHSKTNFSYIYLEIFFSALLFGIFVINKKISSNIISDVYRTLWFAFLLYPAAFAATIKENILFNLGILTIVILWVVIFDKYFALRAEERLPMLERFFETRKPYERLGALLSLIFLKTILDIQILGIEFAISHESLSGLYTTIAQVFGTILSITIMMAIFILGYEKIKEHEKVILARGLKCIFLLASSVFCISIIGIIGTTPDMPLRIGLDMSASINAVSVLMFFLTILLSIYCILFIGMLMQELLGRQH